MASQWLFCRVKQSYSVVSQKQDQEANWQGQSPGGTDGQLRGRHKRICETKARDLQRRRRSRDEQHWRSHPPAEPRLSRLAEECLSGEGPRKGLRTTVCCWLPPETDIWRDGLHSAVDTTVSLPWCDLAVFTNFICSNKVTEWLTLSKVTFQTFARSCLLAKRRQVYQMRGEGCRLKPRFFSYWLSQFRWTLQTWEQIKRITKKKKR